MKPMITGKGYAGRVLRVDLSTGRVTSEPLDIGLARSVIGGWGYNAKLALDETRPHADAYASDSLIVIGAGVLGGTLAPCADKSFATYKCPATGVIGAAVGSTRLSSMLKWAGYDHLVITGRADNPVFLKIADDDVELCDADFIWGKDIYQATDELSRRLGGKFVIACTGPAGENGVNISLVLIDKCATLGRTLGGVFGAKNLKAIAVYGSRGLRVADRKGFMSIVDKLTENHRQDPLRDNWTRLGLHFILPVWAKAGHFIRNNGAEVYPENEVMERFGAHLYEQMKRRTLACTSCMAGDKAVVELREGEHAGQCTSVSLGLISVLAFGMKCGAEGLDQAMANLDMANRYGIDAMGFSALVDWAMELYNRGIITASDTGGLPLIPGYQTTKVLLEQVMRREGLGEILAGGWLEAIRRIGRGSEKYAIHIKGGDPDFDPRITLGVETLGQATNPRGAHDMPAGGLTVALGRGPEFFAKMARRMGFTGEAIQRVALEPGGENLGRYLAHYENWCTVLNCLGLCFRLQSSRLYDASTCAQLYTAATGLETTPEELVESADRAFNIYKFANVREGFDRRQDRFPEKWLTQPIKFGDKELRLSDYFKTKAVTPQDVEKLLDSYYEERGWDIARGVPTRAKLDKLGLR
ncbi:MAG: hypothetical protein HY675_29280 [Chloroflexi bacterium]|nr:hypothetical protein [Chloroflexota bacterium]